MNSRSFLNLIWLATLLVFGGCGRTPSPNVSPAPASPASWRFSALPATLDPALIDLGYVSEVARVEHGQNFYYVISVSNTSDLGLAADGPHATYTTYNWLALDGQPLAMHYPRCNLAAEIPAGARADVQVPIRAPGSLGTYYLKVIVGVTGDSNFAPAGPGHGYLLYKVDVY